MAKKFRVATEGATTDGRKLARESLEQMAKSYDPKRYGARVWLEHMRGMFPDGPFAALGDVLSLSTGEIKDGTDSGKVGLYAEIEPTEKLKEINQQRQKVYSSIEVDPEFADTGEPYMVGMAVTDSPASLGTEMLQFSVQQGENSPLAGRKQSAHNVFTAAAEVDFDFSEEEQPGGDKPKLLDNVKAMFKRHRQTGDAQMQAFRDDVESTLELFVKEAGELRAELDKRPTAERFDQLKADHDKLQKDFSGLHSQLDLTPDTPGRETATGQDGAVETDC